tara:strand:+ start:3704 stop:4957 length:1254 start_codon:yes stop_codon:yes gene_type:complete
MPAKKCSNGKWKWGQNGSCIYNSKKEAEEDNKNYRAENTYNDYPESATNNAKRALKWKEENGSDCGTNVGWTRANQIAKRENLSRKTIARIASFKRHEQHKDVPYDEGCGGLMWDAWGGSSMINWSINKLEEIDKEEKNIRKKVGSMITDNIELPLFDTIEEAEKEAEKLGGNGYHEHTLDGEVVYMPFESHEDIIESMNNRTIKNNNMEKRIFNIETRVESNEEGKDVVVGHASVYNSRSNNLGGFYEYIEKGAFTDELIAKSDVRALINHDPNLILARSTSGTLKLQADEKGLRYEFDMPDTTYGKDLAISMKRGDISQSSFAFTVSEDQWDTDEDGNNVRTITKIDQLYDVSPVTYPAYSQAESDLVVAKRGLEEYKKSLINDIEENIEEVEEKEKNLVRGSLISLNIELKKRK